MVVLAVLAGVAAGQETKPAGEQKPSPMSAETFAGLTLRSIGPAVSSGRIGDLAVDPSRPSRYYVAVASGGVWRTTNGGTTFTPIFDQQGAFSIGCLALDPGNPAVLWVGTGENNSQRSVSFGDGVYRTRDGGQTWENLGLRDTEHIGVIAIDPRDTDTVYVAAQGPLWRSGPERGLYKTDNGGRSWRCVLRISEHTGINEVHLDPRDPDVVYASAYQRQRRVWTLIDGGPESALYKSTDAGVTWRKLTKGLPAVDLGRIGLDISPANPDVVYAIVEAADGEGGFFRSPDRGETWTKRSSYQTTSAQYYNEIICDPRDVDRVYVLDTILHVTEDGGKTFQPMPREHRHVDDHALWIDPQNTDHLIVGCDGGLYDTYDRGENWRFMPNLPVTQFYRVSADNSEPFYYVYGGTQDNNTLGGPSRTRSPAGITSEDWFITVGGDGFKSQIAPEDPNIVYSQWQHGGLIRFDRRSGESVDIRPREAPGDEPLRWNWDSPLLISPHNHQRLYFAANRLFRSDDCGSHWTAVSGDLSRRLDRNTLEVMGRIQPADAVAKHSHTSVYGNIVALDESPLVEGLLYAGTDDGLVQVSEDGGQNWRKIEQFPGVPELTYVSCLVASRHEADTVFAAFDNHKSGEFRPYLLRSPDRGQTWTSIVGDLPERDFVYTLAEDHVQPALLFVGTEFGAFFTIDGGEKWIRLKGGLPTIAVRDLDIQEREDDLVLATFGRGIYILDDYSLLRRVSDEQLGESAVLWPVKDALRYIEAGRLGGGSGRGAQGASYYAAPNPPFGAVFTYYLKDKLMTRRERRKEAEKEAARKGVTAPYPTIHELRAEDEEREPEMLLLVRDEAGAIVRRVPASRDKGIHRVAWDLRYPASTPPLLAPPPNRPPWWRPPSGPLALPGSYTVTLAQRVDGVLTELTPPKPFHVVPLELATFAAADRAARLAFEAKVARLQRAVRGALGATDEAQTRLTHVRQALLETPGADPALVEQAQALQQRLTRLLIQLRGDPTLARREEAVPLSIRQRVDEVVGDLWGTTSPPTGTQCDAYRYAGTAFAEVLPALRVLIEQDLAALESALEAAGGPWTPGRLPRWELETTADPPE
jgi:photosystem II stability/assembly factor-like uncharacterized protein